MDDCFVIMQIGDAQMDALWDNAYVPTIKMAGLVPRRVDVDDIGELLILQIKRYIEDSRLIIADLTNQRPNCYFEIGYALGARRDQDIIFCAREDHNADSKNYRPGSPKIHFDLQGYGVLWWNSEHLTSFANDLKGKIGSRLSQPQATPNYKTMHKTGQKVIQDWIELERAEAMKLWKKK